MCAAYIRPIPEVRPLARLSALDVDILYVQKLTRFALEKLWPWLVTRHFVFAGW